MTTVVQFSWTRLEGLGLILSALGWGLLAQLPGLFWALTLLYVDFDKYLIAIIGTTAGISIILTVFSCSLVEDWNKSITPDFKKVISASLFYAFLFLIGFFMFFFFEPIFPSDFSNLESAQRYFSATAVGLVLVVTATVLIYKARSYFQ